MKKISILGSTGSIGTQTLEVVRNNGDIRVTALAAGSNVSALEQQIREFRPKIAVLYDEKAAADLAVRVKDLARTEGVKILPVDSEHAAIFQCLQGSGNNPVHKILLTASGGPFRGRTRESLRDIRPADALKHPNWHMGKKITIDSSTMVNKGLEVMEAHWLFDVTMDQVQVVVQPQSVIHSMIEYVDGAVIAQLGTPDMKLPIQYALYYPERRYLPGERLDFGKLKDITFEDPDPVNFPALSLAYRAGTAGGSLPTVFNAANELAVAMFLEEKIGYLTIDDMIEAAMDHHRIIENPTVEEILETEAWTREFIESRSW